MELNYFLFAGLILRYLYYWANKTYTFEYFKDKLWRTIVFAVIVTFVFWYISFYGDFDARFADNGLQKIGIALGFVFIGWAVDSVFLSVMKWYESKITKKLEV